MKKSLFRSLLIVSILTGSSTLAQAETLDAKNIQPASGAVISQQGNETFVSGSVNRGSAAHRAPGAHVHVHLLDSKGKTIGLAVKTLPTVAPKRDAAANYRAKFTVGFPAVHSSKASSVRVQYLTESHAACEASPSAKKCCPSC